jgi:hypothetical protein
VCDEPLGGMKEREGGDILTSSEAVSSSRSALFYGVCVCCILFIYKYDV